MRGEVYPGQVSSLSLGQSTGSIQIMHSSKLHVFGLQEETGVLKENPSVQRENMQTQNTKATNYSTHLPYFLRDALSNNYQYLVSYQL